MKTTEEITEAMPENAALFSGPFFERFSLRPAPQPLRLSETVTKHYRFPTLYRDVTCGIGIFLCGYERARKALPDPRLRPVRMPGGRALVTFSCYEYRQVMNVAPYNEIGITIPVLFDAPWSLPVLPMLVPGLFPGFGYFVIGMPVTSKENQLRGNKLWGLPKTTRRIDTKEEGGEFVTTAFEESGQPSLELRVPTDGRPTDFDVRADIYSRLDGEILASRTCFQARFNVVRKPSGKPALTLGPGPDAALLRGLGIEERAFQFRFARGMNAAFDLPHRRVQA
jgi:hypothetical protein